MISLQDIKNAHQRIKKYVKKTPIIKIRKGIYLKLENKQPTVKGFKINSFSNLNYGRFFYIFLYSLMCIFYILKRNHGKSPIFKRILSAKAASVTGKPWCLKTIFLFFIMAFFLLITSPISPTILMVDFFSLAILISSYIEMFFSASTTTSASPMVSAGIS